LKQNAVIYFSAGAEAEIIPHGQMEENGSLNYLQIFIWQSASFYAAAGFVYCRADRSHHSDFKRM